MNEKTRTVMPGPLSGWEEGFADYLTGLGYAPGSVMLRLNLMKHLSRWLAVEGINPAGCDDGAVARFIIARRRDHVDLSSLGAIAPLLTYLRSVAVIPSVVPAVRAEGPVDVLLLGWGEYLASARGLAGSTVGYYRELARPFVCSRLRGNGVDLDGLDARAVTHFVQENIPGMAVGTAKLTVTVLRSLLRYLFVSGLIAERLDGVVPARAGYRDSGLPRGLTAGQVDAVIAAIDQSARAGKRDRAIVMLLARLGLRAGEVSGLQLEDVDWRAATIRVRGKGGRLDVLPVPIDVGSALAEYLRVVPRPVSAGRALFFRSLAPYSPLGSPAVKAVVRRAGLRAGIGPVGAHQLRHSVATATINAGASLEEVAQLLRHRSVCSTTIYAKVDLSRLAGLARPWPDESAPTRDGGI